MVDAKLAHSVTYRGDIAEIAGLDPLDPGDYPGHGARIP
jgi:hypothetical protein